MNDDARDDASRAPVEPADKDSEQQGGDEIRPQSVKQSEKESGDEDGQPRAASRFQQTTKNNAAKTNLFSYWGKNAGIEYSGNSGNKPLTTL